MKKLFYFAFALLMGATIVSCSSDDEYESDTEPSRLGNIYFLFPSDGGERNTHYYHMNLDTVNYAKIYYDSLPRIDTTGIGIDAHIELIGDTTICDWAKMVWDHSLDPKYVTIGKMFIKLEPNTTGRARFMRVGIALKNEDYIEEIVISQEANE